MKCLTRWVCVLSLTAMTGCGNVDWLSALLGIDVSKGGVQESVSLKQIKSEEEWHAFVVDQMREMEQAQASVCGFAVDEIQPGILGEVGIPVDLGAPSAGAVEDSAQSGELSADGGSGSVADFTTTNVQIDGVDESDVIKTDGEFLYILAHDVLKIVKAEPLELLGTYATDEQSDSASASYRDMYLLDGDSSRLVLIGNDFSYETLDSIQERASSSLSFPAAGRLIYKSIALVLDISDPANPNPIARWSIDGRYVNSRMIDGVLHVITTSTLDVWRHYASNTLTMDAMEELIPRTHRKQGEIEIWSRSVEPHEIFVPTEYSGFSMTTVTSWDIAELSEPESVAIAADAGTIYASQEALYITDTDNRFDCSARDILNVHKFGFARNGHAKYLGSGSAKGRLLNQYSLGEHNGDLQLATHSWSDRSNHVYIMSERDGELLVTGSVNDIAPGEDIYAARFVGDRAFLVTFLRIDPLFTLDLSDPTNPRVVGELKVPGFSEYIHMLDANHLLTIGQRATPEGVAQGAQLSIFDVSDFANPALLSTYEFEGVRPWSEASHNPKAFTYYAPLNLLAVPVRSYGMLEFDEETQAYQQVGFYSGLSVFDVSIETGFKERAFISTEGASAYSAPQWTRGVIFDDGVQPLVYAITDEDIQVADLSQDGEVISELSWLFPPELTSQPGEPVTVGVADDTAVDAAE